MSENQPYDPVQPPSQSSPQSDWNEPRREARHDNRGGAWIWGIFLILLGVGFLLQNAGIFDFENWWALFILLPAIGSFQSAWDSYRSAGSRLTAQARGQMIGGFILTVIAFTFLFGFNFGTLWPVLLVIAGVGLLINALLPG